MKITYFARKELPNLRAHSVQIFNTCSAFASNGPEVCLFAWHRKLMGGVSAPSGNWPMDTKEYYGVDQNFNLTSSRGYWFRKLMGQDKRKLFMLGALRHVKFHFGPDDVAFTRYAEVALALANANVPVALEVHNSDVLQDSVIIRLLHEYRPGPSCPFLGVVAISQTLADSMVNHDLPEDSVLVAHDGIDPDKFSVTAVSDVSRARLLGESLQALKVEYSTAELARLFAVGRPVVGYCGHFYPGRGIEMLLECARRRPDWTFLMIGGFEKDVNRYRDVARENSLSNVVFTGYVPNSDVAAFLSVCDILAMPYEAARRRSQFMSPMKMFEYMASGRMIVAADWPQIREVLVDGRNALLHPPADVDALERVISRAVMDEGLRDRLSTKARADVEQYTWKVRGRRIVKWLEKQVSTMNAGIDNPGRPTNIH